MILNGPANFLNCPANILKGSANILNGPNPKFVFWVFYILNGPANILNGSANITIVKKICKYFFPKKVIE